MQTPPTTKGVLSDPQLRLYLFGQLISLTGTMLQGAVLSLLIINLTSKEEAGKYVGLVMALGLLPGALINPFTGVLLDRWSKRKVLIVTGTLGAILTAVLAWLVLIDGATVWRINVIALLYGFINAFDGPGRNAIVQEVVQDKKHVRSASKMFNSLYNLAQIAGPGCAGLLVVSLGYSSTLLLNSLSFVVLIVVLVKIKLTIVHQAVKSVGVWEQTKLSASYVFKHRGIRLCTLLTTGLCVFGYTHNLLLPVINKYMLHGNEFGYSQLASGNGIGSFTGALFAVWIGERISHKMLVVYGMLINGISLLLLSVTTTPLLATAEVFFAGAGFMIAFVSMRSTMLHLADPKRIGAVLGFAFTFFYGGMMACSVSVGPLADILGCPQVLKITAAGLILLAIVTPRLPGIEELE